MEPKTPDFSLDDTSPPHFSYDFNTDPAGSPTGPGFDAFSAYSSGFDTSPRLGSFSALALGSHAPAPSFFNTHHAHAYPSTSPTAHSFTSASTSGRPFTPAEGTDLATISPPLTLGGNGSEVDDTTARVDGRRSSTNSPPSSASASQSQGYSSRNTPRYNPMAGRRPARRSTRRGARRDDDDLSDDDGEIIAEDAMEVGVSSSDIIQRRREEIRRQRIESEQRRRDELRDGYAKLKHALPISNQKSSKVSLLDRAVTYIRQLETSSASTTSRLESAEQELGRLRSVNEQLMRSLSEQHSAVLAVASGAGIVGSGAVVGSRTTSSTAGSAPPSPPHGRRPRNSPSF